MEKKYVLEGLCCANCGNKIESAVKALDGVSFATVNMINTTLQLEAGGFKGDITEEVKRIVRRYEPDVVVFEKGSEERKASEKEGLINHKLVQLFIGAGIFAAGMLLSLTAQVEFVLFLISYIILGWEVVFKAVRNVLKGELFDENFLMTIATLGAFAIGQVPEAAGVMLFYQIGEYFQDLAVRNSKKSISDLMDIRPDFANIEVNGELVKVSPESVNLADIIVVKPGEKIPLDGIVVGGASMLDTKALTGESVPRSAKADDSVLSGCINLNGLLRIQVTKTFGESTVAKIIDLVENSASKKAPTENFITVFSKYYTPAVVIIAALLAVIPPLAFGAIWAEWIRRGLVFLVISCPCALVISIPLGFFGGIGGASKRGVLIKGSNYLEALTKLDTVVFDKTGTLTKGVFKVTNIAPAGDFTPEQVLELAAYTESFSNHPIALSIRKAYGQDIAQEKVKDYTEISGHGISATINGQKVLAGNEKLMKRDHLSFDESFQMGTKVYVAVDGQYAGCITIADEIKEDSKSAIAGLKALGVSKVVMLTGDNAQIAETIGNELELDEVYAELLPADKVEKLEMIDRQKQPKTKLAFVGDGINDAPVLARADIGIAMGGLGSDAAIEAADIVLMTDELSKLIEAVDIARYTKKIVWQNILFALGIKALFLLLGAFGVATLWEAVFADVGVTLLAILNAMRVIHRK